MVAYKIMKHLNKEERVTVHLNMIAKDKWMEYYKELWYDLNVRQEAAESKRDDTGIDSITIDELEEVLSSMKNRKSAGLAGINSEIKYFNTLLMIRLLHLLNMCWTRLRIPDERRLFLF